MKREEMSATQDFLIGIFANRILENLAKRDVIAIGVIDEDDSVGVRFSAAGFRKAKAALKSRRLPPGVRAEIDAEKRILFLVADGLGTA